MLHVTERFESTVVTYVEWNQENGVSYNISTFPEVFARFTGETTVQLIIPYNVQLAVNVSATLCGQITTTVKTFYYGELLLQHTQALMIIHNIISKAIAS